MTETTIPKEVLAEQQQRADASAAAKNASVKAITEKKKRTLGPAVKKVFPGDLPEAHRMSFKFSINEYRKKRYHNYQDRKERFYLQLPVPTNLVDSLNAQYNEVEMGTLGGGAVEALSRGGITAQKLGDAAEAVVNNIFGAGVEAGKVLTSEQSLGGMLAKASNDPVAAAIVNTFRTRQDAIGVGLQRFFGAAPNPYLTTMFRGMALRTHNFTWKLSPASKTEAKDLFDIVHNLKLSLLPERTHAGLSLAMPNECAIGFSSPFLNKAYQFKNCVLRNVSVNYAPDGMPSFFADSEQPPTAINLTLDFLETEIHTRDTQGLSDEEVDTAKEFGLLGF